MRKISSIARLGYALLLKQLSGPTLLLNFKIFFMSGLIVKYWFGWLRPETFTRGDSRALWAERVSEANQEGYEPHIFRIKHGDDLAIADIEQYLQTRYSTGKY